VIRRIKIRIIQAKNIQEQCLEIKSLRTRVYRRYLLTAYAQDRHTVRRLNHHKQRILTTQCTVLLDKLTVAQLIKKYSPIMRSEDSLPRPQKAVSRPHSPNLLHCNSFQHSPLIFASIFQVNLPFGISNQNYVHFSYPHACYMPHHIFHDWC
jgi:hypothetical protein